MICLGINLCIGLYLTVYLQLIKGINIEWATYCPRMIPAATFSGVVCAICLVSSLWPVYGFFAPLILLVICFGSIFSMHFIPWPF
ncbi:hypothetical protein NSK_001422 [Nannochloropsis salina CCMP1776]|uniref:Uncharacterized protein n=1 Tax=Nannochloropsis salina CCMP1776 TaxID=1027361 RepID=A0A4D9DEG2_9STRA|nr:hypothetical protein NSK_001422 [Nannochloropsis salina CCMP1776]|eukprot:TFJ87088.1 hypothetical protein NSK_001422 [Nannochloropsis salina CCMP1776]